MLSVLSFFLSPHYKRHDGCWNVRTIRIGHVGLIILVWMTMSVSVKKIKKFAVFSLEVSVILPAFKKKKQLHQIMF